MDAVRKIANNFWLSPEVTGIIELYAQKAGVSNSVALEQMIAQCSQMVVTGVVEEVTEKDVFEDISRELRDIHEGLKKTNENLNEIRAQIFSND